MTTALAEFLSELDAHTKRVPLDQLVHALETTAVGLPDVREFLSFGLRTYQRNLVHAGPAYHALVLCWRAGQRSPIHDHRGSSCALRVLHGTATETVFAKTSEGLIYPTSSRSLPEGSLCASEDADIHQMSNLQPAGSDLITLHVYSPPLQLMGRYSLTEPFVSEFLDPIVVFAHGEGI